MTKNTDEQLEFDFVKSMGCKCTETTRYDDLCDMCLTECLEWMAEQNLEDIPEWEHG